MTEGELGELLRATASAVIAGETLGINAPADSDAPGPSAVAEPEEASAPPGCSIRRRTSRFCRGTADHRGSG
jgi:hypothetical protein